MQQRPIHGSVGVAGAVLPRKSAQGVAQRAFSGLQASQNTGGYPDPVAICQLPVVSCHIARAAGSVQDRVDSLHGRELPAVGRTCRLLQWNHRGGRACSWMGELLDAQHLRYRWDGAQSPVYHYCRKLAH